MLTALSAVMVLAWFAAGWVRPVDGTGTTWEPFAPMPWWCWAIILLTLAGAVWSWLPPWKGRRPASACPHCGYDPTGNASGRCPECGNDST